MCIHISLPAIAFPALSQVPDLLAVFNKKNHRRAMFREDSSSHGLPLCPDIPNACYLQRGYENKKKRTENESFTGNEGRGKSRLALHWHFAHYSNTTFFRAVWRTFRGRLKEWEATPDTNACLPWGAEHISSAQSWIKKKGRHLNHRKVSNAFSQAS